MKILLLLVSVVCVVQAKIVIQVIQEVGGGGCGDKDEGEGGEGDGEDTTAGLDLNGFEDQLDTLTDELNDLQDQADAAAAAGSAADDAANVVQDLLNSLNSGNGGRRRRHRRSTVDFDECDPDVSLDGELGDVIVAMLDAVAVELENLPTSLDPTMLNCYLDLLNTTAADIAAGDLEAPTDTASITASANAASEAASAAQTAVADVAQSLAASIAAAEAQIAETQAVIEQAANGNEETPSYSGVLTTTPSPISSPDTFEMGSDSGNDGGNDVGFNLDNGLVTGVAIVEEPDCVCDDKPGDDCTTVTSPYSCCDSYICGDLPRNCTSEDGSVYQVGDNWNIKSCKHCYCYHSFNNGAVLNCYNIGFCPSSPHKDCVFIGENEETCCKEFFCDNTTCLSEDKRYGIGEKWALKSDPCENCKCIQEGDFPPEVVCNTTTCPPAPNATCRPFTYSDTCCPYDWDCTDEYLITTPKKWIRGQEASVCVFTTQRDGSVYLNLSLTLEDKTQSKSEAVLEDTALGGAYICTNLTVPEEMASKAQLTIDGEVGSALVSEILTVGIASVVQTFVQTDKFLYMPGQVVQFRILTIAGTRALVSHENLEEVWIVSPGGSRLAQWIDVDNSLGIVQLSFPLAKEVEEGKYQIHVKTEGRQTSQIFRVEEYVLPRFTLSLQPPPYILMADSEIVYRICAEYTYGQPVTGSVILSVTKDYYYWSEQKDPAVVIHQNFSGCIDISVNTSVIGQNWGSLRALATFTEEGTDFEMTTSVTVPVSNWEVRFTKISTQNYYKPGLPYLLQVMANRPDGSAAEGESVSVCVQETCKEYVVEESGIVSTSIPPHLMNEAETRVRVELVTGNNTVKEGPMGSMYSSTATYYITTYYSPSNSSLSLDLYYDTLKCHPEMQMVSMSVFFVASETASALIRTQLVSRSQMLWTSIDEYDLTASNLPINATQLLEPLEPIGAGLVRGSFNIEIPLSPLTSPILHILMWYSRDDGEVVSTSVRADVGKCLQNPTSLSWATSHTPPAPKDPATITISSSPNSICGLGVVDRSVEILSRGQPGKLSAAAVFKALSSAEVQSWENSQVDDFSYCYSNNGGGEYYDYGGPVMMPGIQFKKKRSSLPFYGGSSGSDFVDAIKAFDESGLLVVTDLTLQTRPCNPSYPFYNYAEDYFGIGIAGDIMEVDGASENIMGGDGAGDGPEEDEEAVKEVDDESEERTYFPETWLWELIVINESGEAVEEVHLPDTITEWVGEAVCAHPQLGVGFSGPSSIITFTPFFLDLAFPPTARRGENVPLLVSLFNYFGQNLPVTVTLEESSEYTSTMYVADVCVTSDEKAVIEFVVTPSEVGKINLTFIATINATDDECGGTVAIDKSDVVVRPLSVKFEGVMIETTYSTYMCSNDSTVSWYIETPEGIVEDSNRVFISVSADLLGPTFENLGHLIRMPYGCGEQNMLNFAPNIFILQYLEASDQITSQIEQKLKDYMVAGYQRELNYRHYDGSYSAFGNSDPEGSTWLTAFVLKSFAQAADYITVDEDDLEVSKDWLLSLQEDDGCFESLGDLHHKAMKGGLSGSSTSLAPLTSYVVISLLESNQLIDTTTINNAINCILNFTTPDTYTNALKAYALALASKPTEAEVFIATVFDKLATDTSGLPEAVLVEAAGYLLLAMMEADPSSYVGEAVTVAKLISSHRNGQGGFVSTQDTVVALQALATFNEVFPPSDAALNLSVSAGNDNLEFSVTSENQLLLQTQYITAAVPYNVTVSSSGEGCAVIMLVQRYNVPEKVESSAFEMTVMAMNENCTSLTTLSICASYLLQDGESNMAVFDIEPQTGFSVVTQDLEDLVDEGTIKRYEEEDGNILLYVQSVNASQTCLIFDIKRDFEVADALPGTVTLYDYYQPDLWITKMIASVGDECRR